MSRAKMKVLQKRYAALDKQHSAAGKGSEGDGESKKKKPSIALEKIVASECFGWSRVRCAGWLCIKFLAQAQERIKQKQACISLR